MRVKHRITFLSVDEQNNEYRIGLEGGKFLNGFEHLHGIKTDFNPNLWGEKKIWYEKPTDRYERNKFNGIDDFLKK